MCPKCFIAKFVLVPKITDSWFKFFKSSNFAPSINKSYRWDFPKVAALERSTKRALSSSFSYSYLYLTFYQNKIDKNGTLSNFAPSTNKIYRWDFPKLAVLKRSTIEAMSIISFDRVPVTNLLSAKNRQKCKG